MVEATYTPSGETGFFAETLVISVLSGRYKIVIRPGRAEKIWVPSAEN
jgi:hypothetical protein